MKSKYDIFTKEKRKISYNQKLFINTSLRQLGFKPANNGTIYLKKIIILAYEENLIVIELKKLCNMLANEIGNIKSTTIYEDIKYAVNNVNYTKARLNYEKIFNFSYDSEYFTTRNIVEEVLSVLETIK